MGCLTKNLLCLRLRNLLINNPLSCFFILSNYLLDISFSSLIVRGSNLLDASTGICSQIFFITSMPHIISYLDFQLLMQLYLYFFKQLMKPSILFHVFNLLSTIRFMASLFFSFLYVAYSFGFDNISIILGLFHCTEWNSFPRKRSNFSFLFKRFHLLFNKVSPF